MAKSDGSIIINTKVNTGGFNKGATDLKSQFSNLGASVKKLGATIGVAFSVGAIVAFGKEALELGSDLQEVQNVVDVTFTTMNKQVNEFAKNAAVTAGLSETMAKKYTGTFGAMAKSFKFTEEEAYNMATSLTQLSGDVASFYNLTQDEAYTKLKSVFTGETESLKDLGVVMTQTALDAYALEQGFGKTTNQMTEQEKVALRYQFVMSQLSAASGDFVRTSDSWANQTRILSLQFDQLKASIGQGLIAALTPVIKVINTILSGLNRLATSFANVMTSLFGSSGASSAASGIESVADGYSSAADSASDLAEETTAAGKAAKKSLAGFDELNTLSDQSSSGGGGTGGVSVGSGISFGEISLDATVKDNISPKLDAFIKTITSFGQKIKAAFQPTIDAWGNAFSSLGPSIEDAKLRIGTALTTLVDESLLPFGEYMLLDFVPSMYNAFSTTMAPIFADIMPAAMEIWTSDFENHCLLISEYAGTLTSAFEGVKTMFKDMMDSISKNWETYGGDLMQGFIDFKDGLWETWWYIYDNIIDPVITSCGEALTRLWEDHLEPLWDDIVEFVLSVSEKILTLWNDYLKPVIDWLVTILAPLVTSVIDAAINAVVDAAAVIIKVVSDVISGVRTFLDGLIQFIAGVFTGDWKRAWDGVVKMFEGVWNGLIGIVKGVVNSIIWVINSLISVIYSAIRSIVNGLGDLVEDIGDLVGADWGFSMPKTPPQIPYLAKGAVIPPNAPFMAVLGDQRHGTNIEAPLATIQEAFRAEVGNMIGGMMAGFETSVAVQRQILEAVLGIEIGDTTIGEAASRYNTQMNVIRGG